jgi:hypothetical protein
MNVWRLARVASNACLSTFRRSLLSRVCLWTRIDAHSQRQRRQEGHALVEQCAPWVVLVQRRRLRRLRRKHRGRALSLCGAILIGGTTATSWRCTCADRDRSRSLWLQALPPQSRCICTHAGQGDMPPACQPGEIWLLVWSRFSARRYVLVITTARVCTCPPPFRSLNAAFTPSRHSPSRQSRSMQT